MESLSHFVYKTSFADGIEMGFFNAIAFFL